MNDIQMIPLGKLQLSEANVRKNDSNLFIEEFAASIEAKGILQNLIVVPAKKKGQRRWWSPSKPPRAGPRMKPRPNMALSSPY